LVVPRLLATVAALPLLTSEAIAFGIGAGYLVGVYLLGIDGSYAWANMLRYSSHVDVIMGIIKAVIFGGLIAVISCDQGLNCRQGAEGVGKATTDAVVVSSISILIFNFFLTLLLTRLLT
jgi:phospholipid/cholesterol/gamma-HCH transport system permease protein